MLNSKVINAGLWYTILNFLLKGFGFITLPLFTRLMTKSEFGDYNNFVVWVSLVTIVCSVELYSSINRARFEFEGQIDNYSFSMLLAEIGITCLAWFIVTLNIQWFVGFFGMNEFYIHMLFVCIVSGYAMEIFQTQQMILYQYKVSVLLSFLCTIVSLVVSLWAIFYYEDKFYARVVGMVLPSVGFGILMSIWLFHKGHQVKFAYCKYGLLYCWPFIPHLISLYLLGNVPKIMLTRFSGSEYTAVYSLGCTFMMIATMFLGSVNQAVSPWVFEKLHTKQIADIKQITKPYFLLFTIPIEICLLIVPEVVQLLGGAKYADSQWFVVPLITAVIFQFAYTLYVNVEQYSMKTWAVAGGSAIAAVVCLGLNYYLLQRYSYFVAGYITLFVYALLFAVHYTFVRIIGYKNVYDDKVVFSILGVVSILVPVHCYLYTLTYVRWGLFVMLAGTLLAYIIKNIDRIKQLFGVKGKAV